MQSAFLAMASTNIIQGKFYLLTVLICLIFPKRCSSAVLLPCRILFALAVCYCHDLIRISFRLWKRPKCWNHHFQKLQRAQVSSRVALISRKHVLFNCRCTHLSFITVSTVAKNSNWKLRWALIWWSKVRNIGFFKLTRKLHKIINDLELLASLLPYQL